MDLRRARIWEWLAGVAGVALIVSLFLPWTGDDASAFDLYALTDVLAAAAGGLGVALLVAALSTPTSPLPLAVAGVGVLFSTVALVLLAIELADPPSTPREAGLWLGAAAGAGVFVATWGSLRDTRASKAARAADPGPPPPLPAPPAGGTP